MKLIESLENEITRAKWDQSMPAVMMSPERAAELITALRAAEKMAEACKNVRDHCYTAQDAGRYRGDCAEALREWNESTNTK